MNAWRMIAFGDGTYLLESLEYDCEECGDYVGVRDFDHYPDLEEINVAISMNRMLTRD